EMPRIIGGDWVWVWGRRGRVFASAGVGLKVTFLRAIRVREAGGGGRVDRPGRGGSRSKREVRRRNRRRKEMLRTRWRSRGKLKPMGCDTNRACGWSATVVW